MSPSNEQYVVNKSGKKQAVILPIAKYEAMLEKLDELEAIKEYDLAKSESQTFRPLNKVLEDAAEYRKKK